LSSRSIATQNKTALLRATTSSQKDQASLIDALNKGKLSGLVDMVDLGIGGGSIFGHYFRIWVVYFEN
jgi:hypothetical protein